jgi:hypothetical protein
MNSHFHFLTVVESSISEYFYSSSNNMVGGLEFAGDTAVTAAV